MEEQRSSKALIISVVVVVLALAGIAVYALSTQKDETQTSTDQTDTTQTTSPTTDTDTDATSEQTGSEFIIFNDTGFQPTSLTVKKGSKVTVQNNSSKNVQFSSDNHPTHTLNSEINLGELGPGQTESFTVTKVGTWGFHDHLDESKTGELVVTE